MAKITVIQNLIATLLISGTIIYLETPLLELFTADTAVIAYGIIRIRYILLAEPLNMIIEMVSGFLRGFGESFAPALLVVLGICGTRMLYVSLFFPMYPSFDALMAVYPLSWAITAAALLVLLMMEWKKLIGEKTGSKEEV